MSSMLFTELNDTINLMIQQHEKSFFRNTRVGTVQRMNVQGGVL